MCKCYVVLFANSTLLSHYFKVKCYVDSIVFQANCLLGCILLMCMKWHNANGHFIKDARSLYLLFCMKNHFAEWTHIFHSLNYLLKYYLLGYIDFEKTSKADICDLNITQLGTCIIWCLKNSHNVNNNFTVPGKQIQYTTWNWTSKWQVLHYW